MQLEGIADLGIRAFGLKGLGRYLGINRLWLRSLAKVFKAPESVAKDSLQNPRRCNVKVDCVMS